MPPPSPNQKNGRDARGRFAKGNPGGPGNPHAAAVGRWRTALAEAVAEEDLQAVVRGLVERAKAGEPWAVRELLDRTLGKPTQAVEATVQAWSEPELSEEDLAIADRIARSRLSRPQTA